MPTIPLATAATPASPRRVLIERRARLMGTDVSVHLAVDPAGEARAQANAAHCMDWLAEVDVRLSRFRPESELCQLNRAAGRWFAASPLLYAAVARALAAAHKSDGLFDPTLLAQLERLGYDRDFAQIAHQEITAESRPAAVPMPSAGGWREIALDARHQRIRLPAGVRLDLGGIAKGWAADRALERFCAQGAGALVNVGGDLRLRGGPQPGTGWSVGIRHPRAGLDPSTPEHIATITLSRGGLATSGALRRWWLRSGQRQHHLLDPRTGAPAPLWIAASDSEPDQPGDLNHLATVTALAQTAAEAEVAAKVAVLQAYPHTLQPAPAISAAQKEHGWSLHAESSVALLLTFGTGELRLSANAGAYLATWGTEGAPLPYTIQPTVVPSA
jgi:thiamine biosynthesis lipoprotein